MIMLDSLSIGDHVYEQPALRARWQARNGPYVPDPLRSEWWEPGWRSTQIGWQVQIMDTVDAALGETVPFPKISGRIR